MAKILSLNVHGLNSNKKRHLELREFRQSGADGIMVQETHFDKGGSFAFASKYYPQIFISLGIHKKAGVAILIKRGSPYTCSAQHCDPHGHFIILQGLWQTQEITFCALYAPNVKQYSFLSRVYARIFRSNHGILVGGGTSTSPNQQLRIAMWWAPGRPVPVSGP